MASLESLTSIPVSSLETDGFELIEVPSAIPPPFGEIADGVVVVVVVFCDVGMTIWLELVDCCSCIIDPLVSTLCL